MDSPLRLIFEFLSRHADRLCVDCLAQAVDLPPSQVSMATQSRRAAGNFTSALGVCSRCGQQRAVIKAA